MNKDKSKATWDVSTTGVFIHECLDQIYKKERLGSSFTKDGWKNIMRTFNDKTGRSYDKKQLKNRLDSLRKEWKVWDKLFSRETGISFNAAKNRVEADDEWWERKISENGEYAKFRYKGLIFAKELEILFKDVMASGDRMFAPGSTQRMSLAEEEDDDDVYRPTMDLEEGSGDSEEDLVPPSTGTSMGVAAGLEGITLTTNPPPSVSGGSEKRKRAEGSCKSRKKKTTTTQAIIDAVSRIADASEDRTDALKKIVTNDLQVSDVVKELLSIPEVASDRDFRRRCCNMMMHQIARDMYVGLKADKDALLDWLREHAYNTPEFQKPPAR